MSSTNTTAADRLNLYTWFPFKVGSCGEVHDVILLDECIFENNGRFLENANLYPAKVLNKLKGCPIKLGTVGIDPFVIMTQNYTQNNGSTEYKLTGLSVDILKLVCEKMNLTPVILQPSLNIEHDSYAKTFTELDEGLSDVVTGTVFLIPLLMTSSFDPHNPLYTFQFEDACSVSKSYSWNGKGTDNFLSACLVDNWPCAAVNYSCVVVCR